MPQKKTRSAVTVGLSTIFVAGALIASGTVGGAALHLQSQSRDNLAPSASVLASSETPATLQFASKVADGSPSGYPVDYTREWASYGEGAGSWVELRWVAPQSVDQIVLFDRPNLADQITAATLAFSDGSSVAVGPLNNDGSAVSVSFTSRTITSVRLSITAVSPGTINAGLAEFQVFGSGPVTASSVPASTVATTATTTAPAPTTPAPTTPAAPGTTVRNLGPGSSITASSENPVTGQTARKAVDGSASGFPFDYTREWATVNGFAGSWIDFQWATQEIVDRVVLFDRPNSSDNVTSGTLRFSDGSTVAVGALNNDGLPLTVVFPARSATGLRFTVNSTSPDTANIGLAEFQIWTSTGPAVPTTAPPVTTAPVTVATTAAVPTTVAPTPTTPTIPTATVAPAPIPPAVNSVTLLNRNPSVTGTTGWGVSGAIYDGTQSRTPGSGSFRFAGMFGSVTSSPVKVTPGQPYTLTAYIRTASWPTGNISMLPIEVTSDGGFVRVLGEFGTAGAPSKPNAWQEFATVIVPTGSTNYIELVATRAEEQFAAAGDMWLDDLAIVAGVQARSPSLPRTAFNGTQTRVDARGNWEVLENGAWKPWFPLCVAAYASRSNYGNLAAGGFNCDIWNGYSPYFLEKAKAVGMRSFFQIGQWYTPSGWARGNFTDLANTIRAVNASPASDYLAGYWMDNEAPFGIFSDYEQTARTIQSVDTLNGTRRRPIVQLMNSTYLRAFTKDGVDFSDVLAGYSPTAGGSGPWGHTGDRLIASQLEGISQPASLCQLAYTGADFRASVYGCLAHGGTSLSYFADSPASPVETHGFWSELPAISREVNALLPVIRSPESGGWAISNSLGNRVWPVAMSQVREVGGVAHMIMANMTPTEQVVTFRIDASTYQGGEVRDYFTNQLLATISGNTFTLRIKGSGLTTGSLAIRILPR